MQTSEKNSSPDQKPEGFKNLNLHPLILKAIEEVGYTIPTPIQEQAIPKVLEGCDLQASAQTGTGKTAAFILPALQRLTLPSPVKGNGPRILILVPTRELAIQVAAEAVKYSKHLTRTKTVCIYGGAPYPAQNRELSRPYEILVATPGRLIDHMERGKINLSRIEMLILDEADRMLDMGFIEPVEAIAAETPADRQTLLFSATLKGSVLNLSKRLLKNPIEISVAHSHEKHEYIDQRLHHVDNIGHKHRLLDHLLNDPEMNQAIVFTSTKINADQLVDTLYEQGHNVAALHGDMNQRQRNRTLTQLRLGEIKVLVATDVAARGIDVLTISHVINFDLPSNVEDYVHRIGRTGRAGAKGTAMSFAAGRDIMLVKRIEQFTGQKITLVSLPGFEAKSKPQAGKDFAGKSRAGGFQNRRGPSSGGRSSGPSEGRNGPGAGYVGRNSGPSSSEERSGPSTGYAGRSSQGPSEGRSSGGYAGRSQGPSEGRSSGGGYAGRSSQGSEGRSGSGGYAGRSQSSSEGRSSGGGYAGRSQGSSEGRSSGGGYAGRSQNSSGGRSGSGGGYAGRSSSGGRAGAARSNG